MQSSGLSDAVRGESFGWAVIDAAPDGVIVVEDGGQIVLANRRAGEIFGYGRGELLALSVEDLVTESLRDCHLLHRGGYGTDPLPRTMGDGRQLMGCRRDGTQVALEISVAPVFKSRARIVVATIRLAPDRSSHDRQLRSAEARLIELGGCVIDGLQHMAFALHSAEQSVASADMVQRFDHIIGDVRRSVLEHHQERATLPEGDGD
jgi:PAS domain S-box-containing protein